jgi:peptide/nickel transport system substrate-binding protein
MTIPKGVVLRRIARIWTIAALFIAGTALFDGTAAGAATSSGGVLTMGLDLSGSASGPIDFDPAQFTVNGANFTYDWPMYGGLLRLLPNGSYVPDLASKVTVADPETIAIQIRSGEVFSDGTAFNAAAVKAGLQRNMATTNKGAFDPSLFDISSIDATGPDSLVLHFSQPVASTFYPLLASEESFIVSPSQAPGSIATVPVTAGPFEFKSWAPGEKLVLVKNPKYWDAKSIKLAGVTFVDVAPGPQQVNSLESGLVQAEVSLPPSDLSTLVGDSSLRVTSAPQDAQYLWMPICKSSGPLANVKVRQALSYAINRVQINTALLSDKGEPAWTLYPSGNTLYDKSLTNDYAYNPTKAKKLLAGAGYPHGFSTTVVPVPVSIAEQAIQVIQGEWKKIGVNVQIVQSSDFVNDFYIRHIGSIALLQAGSPGLKKVSGPYGAGNIGNVCGYSNASLTALVTQASALAPNSPQLKSVWDKMQQLILGNALSIYVDYLPVVTAATKAVQNVQVIPYVQPTLNYWGIAVHS